MTVVVAFLESTVIVLTNEKMYANIIGMTWYTSFPFFSLVGGIGITRGRVKRVLWVNLIFVAITPALFFVSLPHVTYQKGQKLISNQIGKFSVSFVSTGHRNVLVSKRYTFFLRPEFYYYEVSFKNTWKHDYYTINPMSGKVMQLKEVFMER